MIQSFLITGYELTFISASRAMQGSAMGLFYLMDGIANILNFVIILYRNSQQGVLSPTAFNFINGVGGLGGISLAIILLVVFEKKYDLGLSKF